MVSAFLVALTLGMVGKHVILGKESSNFLVPVLVSLAGAFFGLMIGERTESFRGGDPIGFVVTTFGSIVMLVAYWGAVIASRHGHGSRT